MLSTMIRSRGNVVVGNNLLCPFKTIEVYPFLRTPSNYSGQPSFLCYFRRTCVLRRLSLVSIASAIMATIHLYLRIITVVSALFATFFGRNRGNAQFCRMSNPVDIIYYGTLSTMKDSGSLSQT